MHVERSTEGRGVAADSCGGADETRTGMVYLLSNDGSVGRSVSSVEKGRSNKFALARGLPVPRELRAVSHRIRCECVIARPHPLRVTHLSHLNDRLGFTLAF